MAYTSSALQKIKEIEDKIAETFSAESMIVCFFIDDLLQEITNFENENHRHIDEMQANNFTIKALSHSGNLSTSVARRNHGIYTYIQGRPIIENKSMSDNFVRLIAY